MQLLLLYLLKDPHSDGIIERCTVLHISAHYPGYRHEEASNTRTAPLMQHSSTASNSAEQMETDFQVPLAQIFFLATVYLEV